ncbi:MAG: glycerol-3-phosphate 1-O-acyltransferase PlsY [Candidatus Omnitrophica bacterium]|nr:glycerol-3-phosphate 1-O-acyltransferase PlsY [Candidatus Omnitrophota bacterium]
MSKVFLAVIISYLIGSIPTAYIFGRLVKGVDIREYGSGNVGATNAFRVLGKLPGAIVLLLDIFKGLFVVVFLAGYLMPSADILSANTFRIVTGICAISGHNWTIFLNFKGGKGVAASLGVLIGICVMNPSLWIVIGLSLLVWLTVFLLSRIISLSSIAASAALPVFTALFKSSPELLILSLLLCALSLWRHKANIKRLIEGSEPRLKTLS